MRPIPSALQSKLNDDVTTLCRCWVIKRADGVTQGFTEHDEDIGLDAVTCRAGGGLTGSEVTQKLGLAVDSSELSGALADDALNESDLAAGRYDGATVEIWLVDWSEPVLRLLLAKGTLGEVRREGQAFTAEVRGLSDRLAQESGRLYTATCSADLGDGRCRIDLTSPAFRGAGAVISPEATAAFTADGLDGFDDGWFTAGKLTFTSGANSGLSVEVKSHRKAGAVRLVLWQSMAEPIVAGDTFLVTAGCDKRFETCRAPSQDPNMKSTYDVCLPLLLAHEGGYSNHPSDPGGPTNFGITVFDYRKYVNPGATAADVRAMTVEEAKRIYRARYWDAQRCDELPAGLDYAVFDYGVNSGTGRSAKVLRRLLGLPDHSGRISDDVIGATHAVDATTLVTRICDERLRFLRSLRTWPIFGAGWGRRVAEVKAAALAMAAKEHHDI